MKKVGEVMTKHVIATKSGSYATHALLQILAGQYSGMPVVDEHNHVIGVISEFDLLKAIQKNLPLNQTLISDIMSKQPITVDVTDTLEVAMDIMLKKGFVRVPVVDSGKLVGVLSRSDILMAYYHSDSITYL